jgi:hypothetical protein
LSGRLGLVRSASKPGGGLNSIRIYFPCQLRQLINIFL